MATKKSFLPNRRFFVPDLSPLDRISLKRVIPRFVFVAESPHISELEADELDARRPLCGKAGREWWSLLGDVLESNPSTDVSLERMLGLCKSQRIAVINAVQYPLDPKVARLFPGADPVPHLGFSKEQGPHSYKKLKNSPEVGAMINALRARLEDPALIHSRVICLGNDAEWFVTQALGAQVIERLDKKIPHPAAWWRKGGLFRKIARERALDIFQVGTDSRKV
jgi:hypothetical protein